MDSLGRLTHDDYTIAFICPMGVELAPVEVMLNKEHRHLSRSLNYILGCMGNHNVVVTVMPQIGTNDAALDASCTTFKS